MAATRRNAAELLAGGVVILVALGFLVYAVANTGQVTMGGMQLKAAFDNVGGLAPGADVRVAGVKVGSVTAMQVDPKTYQAVLTFTVDPSIKLPKDSSATIASGGLLGGGFVSLSPGGSNTDLTNGQTITITQSAVNFEDLLGKFIFNVGSLSDSTQKLVDQVKSGQVKSGKAGSAPPSGGSAPLGSLGK